MNVSQVMGLLALSISAAASMVSAQETQPKALTTTPDSVSATRADDVRFIPVELFTGAKWDGKHELVLNPISTNACATVTGVKRPCDQYTINGPFKTQSNHTQIDWAGDNIPYYQRTFSTRRMGHVESHFTINRSRDGLVRIYDKRKRWGTRLYDGLGSKFPLGYWKQGEVRTYPSRRPTRIEIIELNGPNQCLTFRWTVGDGSTRNSDNNYTFCPNRGFTNIEHNRPHRAAKHATKRAPKNGKQ